MVDFNSMGRTEFIDFIWDIIEDEAFEYGGEPEFTKDEFVKACARFFGYGVEPPTSFEGRVLDRANNKFKDLYFIRHYGVEPGSSIEIYQLDDLGLVPESSGWGGNKQLQWLFSYYVHYSHRHKRCIPTGKGSIVQMDNCNHFLTKAKSARDALNNYWTAFDIAFPRRKPEVDNV